MNKFEGTEYNLSVKGIYFSNFFAAVTTFAGSITMFLLSYLGSNEILTAVGIDDHNALVSVDFYIGIVSTLVFLSFSGKAAFRNLKMLTNKILMTKPYESKQEVMVAETKSRWGVIFVVLIGVLRTSAQVAFYNFAQYNALKIMPGLDSIQNKYLNIISLFFSVATSVTYSSVKSLQLYDKLFFTTQKKLSLTGNVLRNLKQINTFFYLTTFFLAYYYSFISTANANGWDSKSVGMIVLNVLSSAAATLTEYGFSIGELNGTIDKKFQETTIPNGFDIRDTGDIAETGLFSQTTPHETIPLLSDADSDSNNGNSSQQIY